MQILIALTSVASFRVSAQATQSVAATLVKAEKIRSQIYVHYSEHFTTSDFIKCTDICSFLFGFLNVTN